MLVRSSGRPPTRSTRGSPRAAVRMRHDGQKRTATRICLLILAVFALALPLSTLPSTAGRSYYASPQGDDANNGSIDRPWRTVTHALGQLSQGDVLYLRAGTYYEHDIRLRLKGTATAPITMQSYPGEQAVIDGGLPYFRDAPNQDWEVVDDGIHLYRSKRSVTGAFARAWLATNDVQLVEYSRATDIESVNYDVVSGMSPFYMGPGVQLRSDGRVYIRLQPNRNDVADSQGNATAEVPADMNPGSHSIAIFTSRSLIVLDGAEHIVLKGLSLTHAERILDTKGNSHHIEVSHCTIRYGTYGMLIRNGSHDWNIHDSALDNGLPEYVYWTDVKNGEREVAEAYPEFQSVAVDGLLSGVQVRNCVFQRSFDAIHVKAGTVGANINDNVFRVMRDDAIEVETGAAEVDIAHNMFWRIGSGISHTGSAGSAGPVYIHHNVIDNSEYQHGGRPGNYRGHDWPVWTTIDPFGSHDGSGKTASWKVYNNTIVTRKSGYRWNASGPTSVAGNGEKYVYNNIFYVVDDRVAYRDDLASEGSHYDGNVIFRLAAGKLPLFLHFGDGRDYESLAGFRERSGTVWEAHGLEVDPGFELRVIEQPAVVGATMWERYRPTNPSVFTRGASYNGLKWPGTEGVDYRGAVPPEPATTAAGIRGGIVGASGGSAGGR
jgi:hypothetical protein